MTGFLAEPAILPTPAHYEHRPGSLSLTDGLSIACPPELAGVARWFSRVLAAATGWDVSVVPGGTAGAQISLSSPSAAPTAPYEAQDLCSLEASSYLLTIDDGAVSISGGGPAGVFYGLQTLRQLLGDSLFRSAPLTRLPSVAVRCCVVVDQPGYAWRGVHLDVSRHFMPKHFVLRLIDLIAMHKCNVLHLHLTDDQGWRMEVESYPRLTEIGAWRAESQSARFDASQRDGRPHGGYYTKSDLAEIVAYAAERFVCVLPEVDMPGHMVAAIAAYRWLGNSSDQRHVMTTWGISDHVLNLEPATLQFCKDVLDEVVEVFPFKYVHAGGDECPVVEWETSPSAQRLRAQHGLSTERELQGWFTSSVAEHLADRGRVLVGWDEILDGGAPPGSVVMSWQSEQGGVKAAAAGHDVVMAPQHWLYFDWSYADDPREPTAIFPGTTVERVHKYDPVFSVPEADRNRVIGAQCQLWTEYVADSAHAEYMYFPRVCAFSEVVWAGGRSQPRPGFPAFEATLAAHLRRLDALDVNYRPLNGPTPGQSCLWAPPPSEEIPAGSPDAE